MDGRVEEDDNTIIIGKRDVNDITGVNV